MVELLGSHAVCYWWIHSRFYDYVHCVLKALGEMAEVLL